MKKLLAAILSLVMVVSMFSTFAFAEEAAEAPAVEETTAEETVAEETSAEAPEYTKEKTFTGVYGFGEADITVRTNDAEDIFYITFYSFDFDQVLTGTVADGVCTVEYDASGFMAGDCQEIWDDAHASENPWTPISEYTKQKVFTGVYGFGEADITVLTNDAEDIFYITFYSFDFDQVLSGTVADGICTVEYDASGFMAGDCQEIWDDAHASENPWTSVSEAAVNSGEVMNAEDDTYAIENIEVLEDAPLAGKQLIFLGSSITEGVVTNTSFADYIAARNGIEIVKEAAGGTKLIDDGAQSYIQRMLRIDPEFKADAFICQLSTNDASGESPLGEISDSTDPETFDTQTVIGAIEYIIAYAQNTWNCPVIFFTNPKYDDANYEAMVIALEAVAEKWNISLINLWENEEVNQMVEADRESLMYDFIHPRSGFYYEVWTPIFEEAIAEAISE